MPILWLWYLHEYNELEKDSVITITSRLYTIDPWQYNAIVEKKLLSAFMAAQGYSYGNLQPPGESEREAGIFGKSAYELHVSARKHKTSQLHN